MESFRESNGIIKRFMLVLLTMMANYKLEKEIEINGESLAMDEMHHGNISLLLSKHLHVRGLGWRLGQVIIKMNK